MAPKKAEPAGNKVEPVQELPPSALELLLPTWSDATAQQEPAPSGRAVGCRRLIRDCYAFALLCFALQVLPRVIQLHDKML